MRAIKPKEERTPRSQHQRLSLAATASATPAGARTESSLATPPAPQSQSEAEITAAQSPSALFPGVESPAAQSLPALPATFTAVLVAVDDRGQGWIRWSDEALASTATPPANARTQPARTTIALAPEHVGREVLVCRAGTSARAVIVGVLIGPADTEPLADPSVDLIIERRRIVFAANTELVLRCGDGSITLAADGKVSIRGMDVVSSATRTQRIRGGAVRIN
jgi:hypothetical protein